MNIKLKTEISLIRGFNRYYTNILGLIDQHILKSAFSLSEVRVLHEIDKTENCTSKFLSETLCMDAGYLSRIIKKFEKVGFLYKEQSASDGRSYNLYMTDTGREHMAELNHASSLQIAEFLKPLPEIDRDFLVRHMTAIEMLLTEGKNVKREELTVRTDIRPGDAGYITYMHGWIYQEEYGYSSSFEGYVADSFSHFLRQYRPDRDRLWCVEHHGNIIGCIGIVNRGEHAQLRWFLVDPHYRGLGLGQELLNEAIAFAKEAGYRTLYLDTTNDLNTAISMYQKAGFVKCGEKANDSWRKGLTELEMKMELREKRPV